MRCACGLSSASRITLMAGYFFFFVLLGAGEAGVLPVLVSAGLAGESAAGGVVRASGWVSSAELPVTGATVTSPVKPGVASAVLGTVSGISRFGGSMVGVPLFAAPLMSGLRRKKSLSL